jgi:hypothetical protein
LELASKEPYESATESFTKAYTGGLTPGILKTYPRILADSALRFIAEAPRGERKQTPCAVVMADGTGMPMRPEELQGVKGRNGEAKTREVKVGAIFEMFPSPENLKERERLPGTTEYVATLERKAVFADTIRSAFDRKFPISPDVTLFLGDGAPWIWNMRRTHFPFAVEILDFYHAAEHLSPLLELAALPEKERKKTRQKWRRWLMEGKTNKLIETCEKMAQGTNPVKAQAWRKALQYYRDNRCRMKYDEYLAKGWFIGSGVVESACKTLIGRRFKLSGMRWSIKGADALLPFRTALMSGRYDELWNFILDGKHMVAVA